MLSYIENSDVVTETFKKYFFLSEGTPQVTDLFSIIPFIGFFLLMRSVLTNLVLTFSPGIMKHNKPSISDKEVNDIKHKLADQAVKLVFHATAALFAAQYFGDRDWWIPHMMDGKDTVTSYMNLLDKVFFMYQAGYHMQSLIHFFFLETQKKADDLVMGIHHIVTILLIVGSYLAAAPYMQVGICVFYVHDASDVFVANVKSLNYLQMPKPILGVSLLSSILGWIYFRIYSFMCHIIHVAYLHTMEILEKEGYSMQFYVHVIMTALMCCLWTMHVYWLRALLTASFRLVTKSSGYDATDEVHEKKMGVKLYKQKKSRSAKKLKSN